MSCAANSVLLFSARGSGDVYGAPPDRNRVGSWTVGAGTELIAEGWNVRDLQAIYPAPPVPPFTKLAFAFAVGGAAGEALAAKTFRDAVSASWQSVLSEIEAAYRRCPSRPILLGGYSQGAILLRYVVPRLPSDILRRIVSVDLFADPTEQKAVDAGLQHPSALDGRLTTDGIDTYSGSITHVGTGFRQTPYPASIQSKVFQYCLPKDLICDFSLGNLNPLSARHEGKTHSSYRFQLTGEAAAKRLGTFSSTQPSANAQTNPATHHSILTFDPTPFVSTTCSNTTPVIDVALRGINSPDAATIATTGPEAPYWASDNWTERLRVWHREDGTFCAIALYDGTFTTLGGTSPNRTGKVNPGITGSIRGGRRFTFTGDWRPSRQTTGNLGVISSGCTIATNRLSFTCQTQLKWESFFFASWSHSAGLYDEWLYSSSGHGTWLQTTDGNRGDITG